ncbi:IS66 family transposase [Anaerobutyricum hallii]|uniref:IS66 family transposase n=1 Tax=Anaerobutyricum hallii TaxID=39488 RepID=UPI002ED4C250
MGTACGHEPEPLWEKDGTDAGSKSFMWVYCTGGGEEKAVILYEYQKTRKADHPEKFLKDYEGVCVTDGYQVYHKLAKEKGDLTVAGCWAHARRRYEEAVKALPAKSRKSSLAWQALEQINMIYHVDNTLKELTPEERKKRRQDSVKPLVEAYFAWVKEKKKDGRIAEKSKTGKGLSYSLNQEEYLKVFLENGNVPLDNNAAERAIRNFCIGRKNWVIIDTIRGAQSSAMIYSIAETAKANHLKPYEYFEYLLEEIPKHMDDKDLSFCEDLLPWSPTLLEKCRKTEKK